MENNINKDIKKEFRNREIQPSSSAWSKLETKLVVTESTKEKNKYRFIAYAAVFIGLLFSLVFFLQQKEIVNNQDLITNKKMTPSIIPLKKSIQEEIKEELKNRQELVKTKPNKESNSVQIAQKEPKKINTTKKKVTKQVIIPVKGQKVQAIDNSIVENAIVSIDVKMLKKQEKKITKPKTKRKLLFSSDEDIDALLANAVDNKMNTDYTSKQIAIQKEYLLYTLENENNKKFGKKLLDKVKNGVHAVESYVSHNN